MRREARLVWVLVAVAAWFVTLIPNAAHGGSITAIAGILIDRQTGQVLWQRNPDLPLPPASTTKILTALLAIKSGRLAESFPVSAEAAETPPSKISVQPGWRFRLRDLVYAILLKSANDASVVAAEGLGGSVEGFAARMNAQARTLGAVNSHFVNPHGLPAANHYSTARDLTTIFSAGLQLPLFRDVLETKRFVIAPAAGGTRAIALHSHNRLLLSDYPIKVIGKTGWTIAAKKCFVGAASSDGRELLVAVLGSRDLWGDVRRLVDDGFRLSPRLQPDEVDWASAAADASSVAAGDSDDTVRPPRHTVHSASARRAASATKAKITQRHRAKVKSAGTRTKPGRSRGASHKVTRTAQTKPAATQAGN